MKKNHSLLGICFFLGFLISCSSNSVDRPALESLERSDPESKKDLSNRFLIQQNRFGPLHLGKFTYQEVKSLYPEYTVDTVEALDHKLEHYLSRKSYWFRKGNKVCFVLILKADPAAGDTIEAVEIRSPEFSNPKGIKTGMTAQELVKISPTIKISQGEIEYEHCEVVNDSQEGLTYYFNTEWGKRIGRYQYEEDSETASELEKNLTTPIYEIYLYAPDL